MGKPKGKEVSFQMVIKFPEDNTGTAAEPARVDVAEILKPEELPVYLARNDKVAARCEGYTSRCKD